MNYNFVPYFKQINFYFYFYYKMRVIIFMLK